MATVEVELYRFRNPDGTEKDWAVPVALAPTVLTVFYGRTGSALRQADTPWQRCREGSPAREAEVRLREKTAKGYRHLGRFRLADNRRDWTPAPASAPPSAAPASDVPALPPPCWYWRWTPGRPPAETARRLDAIRAACADASARLATVGWALPDSRPDDDGHSLWARLSDVAYHGTLLRRAGNEPQLAFWLLLARRCDHLSLVDDDQRPVTQWPDELPVAAEILETLGLKPQDLRPLLAAAGDDGGWFF